jgi:hypothetical protein
LDEGTSEASEMQAGGEEGKEGAMTDFVGILRVPFEGKVIFIS